MHARELQTLAEREISELHHFFQAWFRGEAGETHFRRLETALAEEFLLISPNGRLLDRNAVVEGVRSQRGVDVTAELRIERVRVRRAVGKGVLVTYEEWQRRNAGSFRGRVSSVLFSRNPRAPNGLAWEHLHECWLRAADRDEGRR